MSGGFSGGGSIPQSSDEQSTTQAGIAQGTIIVRDNPSLDLGGLNRDASLADAHGLTDSFDPQKEAENQQLGMLAAQVGMTAAGDLGQMLTQPYTQAAQQAVQDQQALNSSVLSESGLSPVAFATASSTTSTSG